MLDSGLGGLLTPKFYVALTGTSSLISGLILIFEWWYFRNYGASFIEQVSLSRVGPWLGRGPAAEGVTAGPPPPSTSPPGEDGAGTGADVSFGDCDVWRNPLCLLRGAEYSRLWDVAQRSPLSYHDMNLTAQEHQAWFGCVNEGPDEEALGRAWRERDQDARVAAAREALRHAPDTASALLLLAEEDAPTVVEAERVLRRAWRAAEASLRGGAVGVRRTRDSAVLAHVKRRSAVCQRRLGRLRDAARAFRDLARETSVPGSGVGTLENLVECLLEQRLYPEAQAALARLEETGGARTACALYTRALLLVRVGGALAEDALRAAIDGNPHAAEYLLERRELSLPPEHVLRGGASEGLAYAFFHQAHWFAAGTGVLEALEASWRMYGAAAHARAASAPGSACAACVDSSLLGGDVTPTIPRAVVISQLPMDTACITMIITGIAMFMIIHGYEETMSRLASFVHYWAAAAVSLLAAEDSPQDTDKMP